tara:strand:- start:1819 stop:2223 length:405 start_codon:yes stop_codon:yes gene_type:complete
MSDKIISLLCGIIFGIGLVISGMTNPEKVIGFLSVTRNWDASLIFVMGGAIIITAPFFYLLKNKKNSYLGFEVIIPKKNGIDIKLVIGSLLFGIGWGLSGLCPGPSVSAISVFNPIIIFFLFSMIVGILFNKFF